MHLQLALRHPRRSRGAPEERPPLTITSLTEAAAEREERLHAEAFDRELDILFAGKDISSPTRGKLKVVVNHYRKFTHPFSRCVADNKKRFGPVRARLVCGSLKDAISKAPKGGKTATLSTDAEVVSPEIDDDVMKALDQFADGEIEKAILAAEEAAKGKVSA